MPKSGSCPAVITNVNCDTPGLKPGDLCEGDGECGTDKGLNNCDGVNANGVPETGADIYMVCPLSLEIFEDPVFAADGHSYERREIEAWFGRGKTTSPKTNAELPHAFLVPNRHLKAMCQQFLDEVREVEEAGG